MEGMEGAGDEPTNFKSFNQGTWMTPAVPPPLHSPNAVEWFAPAPHARSRRRGTASGCRARIDLDKH